MFAGLGHEAVVLGGEGGVDAAGLVGGDEQRFPQDRVAGFGGAAVSTADTGGVQVGTRPVKDRAPAREANRFGSPSRPRIAAAVTPTPGAEARMPCRVACHAAARGAFVEVLDLLGQLQASRASMAMSSARSGKSSSPPAHSCRVSWAAARNASACASPQAPREWR